MGLEGFEVPVLIPEDFFAGIRVFLPMSAKQTQRSCRTSVEKAVPQFVGTARQEFLGGVFPAIPTVALLVKAPTVVPILPCARHELPLGGIFFLQTFCCLN